MSIDSSGYFFLTQLNCSGLLNGGKLTTDANGQVSCAGDTGGGAGGVVSLNVSDGSLECLGEQPVR